jgi:hypothetical protein
MSVDTASLPPASARTAPDQASQRLRPALGSYGQFGGRLAVGVVGLGLLVIAIGWYGASGEGARVDGATDLRAQLPYLLSGGFLGLSLVVLGAALLIVQSSRLERARSEALLEARFDRLAEALGAQLRDPLPAGMVVAGSAAYHQPHCRLVDGRPGQDYVTVDVAEDMGLRPCRVCGT